MAGDVSFPKLDDPFRQLVRQMEWADALLWQAIFEEVQGPDDPHELDEKVRGWVHHIHTVQHAFLLLWRGEPLDLPQLADFPDVASLVRWGREAHVGIQEHLFHASDEALRAELKLPWAADLAVRFGGPVQPVSVTQTALQLVTHSTHHRGQVAARLRELEVEPPLMDFIAWLWQDQPDPPWPVLL